MCARIQIQRDCYWHILSTAVYKNIRLKVLKYINQHKTLAIITKLIKEPLITICQFQPFLPLIKRKYIQ